MDLVRFTTKSGAKVLVESDDDGQGFRDVGISDRLVDAKLLFDEVLLDIGEAADVVVDALVSRARKPESVEVEFGVTFSAESGAVIAKAALGGNLKVKVTWKSDTTEPPTNTQPAGATAGA